MPSDFEKMVALQDRNLDWELGVEERKDGFLSTAYTAEQFRQMDQSLCVFVGVDGDRLCGYLCATRPEFYRAFPIPAAMLEHCSQLEFQGRPVTSYHYYVANPVCIDRDYRGTDLYVRLCVEVVKLAAPKYDLAVGFISTENRRHLSAVKKMNPQMLGRFEKDGQTFEVMVFPMPR